VGNYSSAGQATDNNMAHAHCMLDTQGYTHTHTGYVILIAFPPQQWLHERPSMLRYTYIAGLVYFRCYFVTHVMIHKGTSVAAVTASSH
jgi:hypothetical protein